MNNEVKYKNLLCIKYTVEKKKIFLLGAKYGLLRGLVEKSFLIKPKN